jgi:formylglycine-generating enzyme required for sulfatase activity
MKLAKIGCVLVLGTLLAAMPAEGKDKQGKKPAPRKQPPKPVVEVAWQEKSANLKALRRAIEDLTATFGDRYRGGPDFLRRLAELEARADEGTPKFVEEFQTLRREALLANPLVDFDRLLLVKRKSDRLGLPQNWQGNCALPRNGYDNEIDVLSPVAPGGKLTTLFRPQEPVFVGDVDLHFDADKMLFSMPAPSIQQGRWQVWEIKADGSGLRQVTDDQLEVDNYDACYLPNGRILFDSTRCFQGVPCVGGGNTVANLCLLDPATGKVRQLCFDQDHDWCPTVMNDGRVLYSRWEYSDSPHYFTRLLFQMNPDGTGQSIYYGTNSLWPNSIFYARPIPNHPTKVVAVISGHHGVPRMGELLIFDPAKGRHKADGVVQRIPGYGVQVQPVVGDQIVKDSWPKFLHPYPLSEKYFLVSCKPAADAPWGICLVDVFDNLLPILQTPGYAMLEPLPLRKTPRPPVIPDRVDPSRQDAVVYLSDVYAGKGLEGVPQGTVKKLRIYEPHYAYPGMGGHIQIGIDGPWDVHRIHGTVPVEADGSASFRVPANTPLAVQPLDADGRALQVMRSWFTAMPGETVSCVGCHESQNSSPPRKPPLAMLRPPSEITCWYGPARGFSFRREVQPVLDKYCVGCHDGSHERPNLTLDRRSLADNSLPAKGELPRPGEKANAKGKAKAKTAQLGNFTPSYCELHPYVRRPGPESDYVLQRPLEWHASTSELVQMLEKGHHNVKLDAEAWDRLVTWIDLNVPDHGTWTEYRNIAKDFHDRRLEMRTKFANRPEDPEQYPSPPPDRPAFIKPEPPAQAAPAQVRVASWPFDAAEAKRRQAAAGLPVQWKLDLDDHLTLDLTLIPAGEFLMGSADGQPDESPQARVKIARPFYLGKFEVTNAQYACFDPGHDSAYISVFNKDQASRGLAVNGPEQPVIRVSWDEAQAFCAWLSAKTGKKCRLPSEAQWEYAARAGTSTPLYFGDAAADFSKFANLADQRLTDLCRRDSPKWIPAVKEVSDGSTVTSNVGRYQPNAWGLYDVEGNAAEWTRTAYRPYPYDAEDGRDDPQAAGDKSVRGGSFYDRPQRARSASRGHYAAWQRVFDVGFRVMMEAE